MSNLLLISWLAFLTLCSLNMIHMNSNPPRNLPEPTAKPMLGATCFSNGIVTLLKSAEIYGTHIGKQKQGVSSWKH